MRLWCTILRQETASLSLQVQLFQWEVQHVLRKKCKKKCQNRKIISRCLMRINWDRVQFLKVSKNFFPPLVHSLHDLYRFRNSPSFPIPCLWRRWIVLIPFFFVGSLCLFAYSWVEPSTFEPLPQRAQVRARASMSAVSLFNVLRIDYTS